MICILYIHINIFALIYSRNFFLIKIFIETLNTANLTKNFYIFYIGVYILQKYYGGGEGNKNSCWGKKIKTEGVVKKNKKKGKGEKEKVEKQLKTT